MVSLSKQCLFLACYIAFIPLSHGWLSSSTPSSALTTTRFAPPQTKRPAFLVRTRLHEGSNEDDKDKDEEGFVDKSPREVAYETADAVADMAEDAKENIDEDRDWEEKSVYEKAKIKAGDAKDFVKEKATDAKDYVKDKAVAVKDALAGDDDDDDSGRDKKD